MKTEEENQKQFLEKLTALTWEYGYGISSKFELVKTKKTDNSSHMDDAFIKDPHTQRIKYYTVKHLRKKIKVCKRNMNHWEKQISEMEFTNSPLYQKRIGHEQYSSSQLQRAKGFLEDARRLKTDFEKLLSQVENRIGWIRHPEEIRMLTQSDILGV